MEELKILDLTKYYVERYSLKTEHTSNANVFNHDGLSTYQQALTRILKKKTVSNVPLWEIIKKEKTVRSISVAEFEAYCFMEWYNYIKNNCNKTEYNHTALELDLEHYNLETHWETKAKKVIEEHNDYLASLETGKEIPDSSFPDSEMLKETGYQLMLEAIYNIFYQPFKWERLKHDIQTAYVENDGINPCITRDTMKARARLKNYRYYAEEKNPSH